MPDSPATLYLIDSHALIYQMFHAIPAMSTPDGRPVNAVFGVTRDLINIAEDIRPTYLISTFDTPEPTFRNELYPEYKAHREPPPPDLCLQIPIVHAVLEAMNLPILAIPGWEADDIMATVATAAAARGIDVTLCTSDKDCRQLIGDRVTMLNMRKRAVMDRQALIADWGVAPEQVVDFQTLVGDSVDNIKGVPGVGAKTAAKLLQQYGTLDNLMAHVEEIKQPKLKENLRKTLASGDLELCGKLVRLETQVPMNLDWENWSRHPWDGPKLLAMFEELGFRGFASRVRGSLKATGQAKNAELLAAIGAAAPQAATSGMSQGDLFAGTPDDVTPDEFPFGARRRRRPPSGRPITNSSIPPKPGRISSSNSRNKSASRSTWKRPASIRYVPKSSAMRFVGRIRKGGTWQSAVRTSARSSTRPRCSKTSSRFWKIRRSPRSTKTSSTIKSCCGRPACN